MFQRTIKKEIVFEGKGLHNNNISKLKLYPSFENSGIQINGILINPLNVTCTSGMTTIKNFSQIEHLMSCLFSLGIDNLNIILEESHELPILDGCSREFIDKILESGVVDLDADKNIFKIEDEINVLNNDSSIKFIPSDNDFMEFECIVDFPYIGSQKFTWKNNDFYGYYENISNALTFFWDSQLEEVKGKGGAKGVTEDNTIILTKENVSLYKNNEFARHKLLDLIGDLATLNIIFPGKIIAYKHGNSINNLFIRKIQNYIVSLTNYEIPFMKLPENRFSHDLKNEVNQIFENKNYIDNNLVLRFEKKLEEYLNVNNVIAVNCGTSALMVSILSLQLDDNDIIIIPRLTFWATYQAAKILNRKIILVDVDQDYQMDLDLVKEIIKEHKIKVILTVHLYGIVSNKFNELQKICQDNKIILIEDSSQAFGSVFDGKHILENSYVSCVSMYPTKIFGSCGNSGFIVTSDDILANKMRSFRDNGRKETRYDHYFIGGNFVMDSINAVYNTIKLNYIDDIINNTSLKFSIYHKELKNMNFIEIPNLINQQPNGFNYTIKILIPKKRDKIINKMKEDNITCSIIYPKFISDQEGYQFNKLEKFKKENDKLCQNILSIPLYYDLNPAEQIKVIDKLKENDCINIVVFGCGNMGMKHLNNILLNDNFNLLGFLDYNDKIVIENVKKLSKIDENHYIDAAIISVNTENHFKIAKKLIDLNINLLVEKPGFLNDNEFDSIIEASNNRKILVGIPMIERYNSFFINNEISNYLDKIYKIEIKRITPYSRNFNSDNILLDLFIHDLDILVFYLNFDLDFLKLIRKSRNKDIIELELIYDNKIIIDILVGNSEDNFLREHVYYCEKEIKYDFKTNENKLRLLHADFENFLLNKENKICKLEDNKKLVNFINKIFRFI